MEEQLKWKTEQRKISDLIPTDANPRKLSAKGRERLKNKIKKLGVFEIPAVDEKDKLLNFNQRLKILLMLGMGNEYIDVRVPNRPLTEEERKEIVLSSNIHEGEWDVDILESDYADIDLSEIGMEDSIMSELEKVLQEEEDEQEDEKPEMPIVAEFSEKYEAFVIVASNEIDANYIKEILQVSSEQCYKSSHVGSSQVISAKKFMELWKQR
jgi:hypothetical protein